MRNFLQIASGVDVLPLKVALFNNPGLWKKDIRTQFKGSPFKETEEIILRFFEYPKGTNVDDPKVQTKCEFTDAWQAMPELRPVVSDLMRRVNAYSLERMFISRMKPGARILPHADVRGAYANISDMARYHVVIQGLPGSLFRAGEETIHMSTGDVWSFNARVEHEVINNSVDDRIHLLIDMRLMC